MGPFPHDAPPAAITPENPMGTDGFAFVEFAHPEPLQLHRLFRLMGFAEVARHRSKTITVYRQGDVDYLDQRFRSSNHIRPPCRAYRPRCERRAPD